MFSVVIPLYNKELSIQNTILSVLNQSYQNFEIVVINDGSTDSSVNAVKSISDERIRLIHQENQGVSAARNRGIKEASYEWIAFLDGDDLWESNHLEEIVKMMKVFPNEKVYVTSFKYSDNRFMYKHKRKSSIFRVKDYFKEAIREQLIWTSVVVIHSSCFKKIGYFNKKLNRGEDLDLWVRLARQYIIIKSKEITAIYKVDAENRTGLSLNLDKTHVYYFNIDFNSNESEMIYLKSVLFYRLLSYLRCGEFRLYFNLKGRYKGLKNKDFILFIFKHYRERVASKI
ncbi:glycosyltransferase family 2 protein [Acinetobacter pseudolwoffii]|uniref:glycosyltransferase family 2 protein n=1 Tax=Acinetobacter pseudolwoffii TaxID=2053287 RepID=UPI003988CBC2